MVALVVVVIDEGFDLGFEITGQEVVFQQNEVLEGLMPALDLTLGLGMIGRSARVLHAFALQPFSQFARDVAGSVVAEQARLMNNVDLVAARCLQSQVQRVRHVLGSHVRTEFPRDDVPAVVLFQHYLELDRRVKRAASQDEVCMRMMTVPGVGPIAALTFKAAIDDPTRFKRSRTVAAHFGLTPRRFQSGEHDNPGRISKAGDRNVRATLYAAANALLMRTMAGSQIKSWGMRLMRTKGRRRAVVAVARKLAVLLHRMWIDGSEFRQDQVGGTA